MDEEESSMSGSDSSSVASLPFTMDEIKEQVELKLEWYLNEMVSYTLEKSKIKYIIDLISQMYGLSN